MGDVFQIESYVVGLKKKAKNDTIRTNTLNIQFQKSVPLKKNQLGKVHESR